MAVRRRIGVLALQGGFSLHAAMLQRTGFESVEVRAADVLADLAGLVLPGGESTTQLKLIDRFGLREPLDAFVRSGRPVLATCAGLILAAARVTDPEQTSFGWIDVHVRRNGWGRQLDSFESDSDRHRPVVFIRAPRIVAVGQGVEVLDTLDGEPIAVRGGNVLGLAHHPELADDASPYAELFA